MGAFFLVLCLSVGVWAYNTAQPAIFGHSSEEIDVVFDGELVSLQEAINGIESSSVSVDYTDCHNFGEGGGALNIYDGGSQSALEEWSAQCNDNYVLVGIYDDNDAFDDIDNLKCCRLVFG